MKAIKKAFYGTLVFSACGFVALGSFNSFDVNNKSVYLKNDFNIKFAKRLDEMTGEFEVGRMAASIPKTGFQKKSLNIQPSKKKDVEKPISLAEEMKKLVKKNEAVALQPAPESDEKIEVKKEEENTAKVQNVAGALLVAGFINKTPLQNIPVEERIGELDVIAGEIRNLSLTLPDGSTFNPTFIGGAMKENVFEYEDTGDGKTKTGVIYPVEEIKEGDLVVDGHYVITFMNDSQFETVRLEFKTPGFLNKKGKSDAESNWSMNDQNENEGAEPVEQAPDNEESLENSFDGNYASSEDEDIDQNVDEEVAENVAPEYIEDEFVEDNENFAQGEEDAEDFEDEAFEDEFVEEDIPVETTEMVKKKTYAFKFAMK